jgi:hypothetical protein
MTILSEILLDAAVAVDDENEVDRIKKLTDDSIDKLVDLAVKKFKAELKQGVAALRNVEDVDAGRLNEKFAADGGTFTFRYAGMDDYHNGLEGMIGNPDPRLWEQMKWEVRNL